MPKFYNHHYFLSFVSNDVRSESFRRSKDVGKYRMLIGENTQFLRVKSSVSEFEYFVLGSFYSLTQGKESMTELLKTAPTTKDEFLDFIDSLVGVFLILRLDETGHLEIYNDCASCYKCYYSFDSNHGITAIASDPIFLENLDYAKIDETPDALEYYNSESFKEFPFRIGSLTSFRNVRQLLPNHALFVQKKSAERVFPRKARVQISMEEAANKLKSYFDSFMSQVATDHNIFVSITAGWDSRMVLASTLDYKSRVSYYTFLTLMLNEKHMDLTVSKKLAENLGLQYQVVRFPKNLNVDLVEPLKANFQLLPKWQVEFVTKGLSNFNSPTDLVLEGTVSEIAKNYYEDVRINNGDELCRAAHYAVHPYTKPFFQAKFEELSALQMKFGYDLRDIAHWEQDITNFAAQNTFFKQSYARVVPPFNSRLIINTLLSLDRSQRDKQSHEFYHYFIAKYHPDLAKFKVNPKLKVEVIRWMKKLGLYSMYRNLANKL